MCFLFRQCRIPIHNIKRHANIKYANIAQKILQICQYALGCLPTSDLHMTSFLTKQRRTRKRKGWSFIPTKTVGNWLSNAKQHILGRSDMKPARTLRCNMFEKIAGLPLALCERDKRKKPPQLRQLLDVALEVNVNIKWSVKMKSQRPGTFFKELHQTLDR